MKKLLFFIMALLLTSTVYAQIYQKIGGLTYALFNDNTAEVIGISSDGTKGDIVIPSFVTYQEKRYVVRSIEGNAFHGCSGLTSVEIPNTVLSIGGYAFSECSALTSVEIPNSVTSIESGTFTGCSGLTSLGIPNSVTSIGEYAFSRCSSLTSIVIPNTVTSIGYGAFYSCSSLVEISVEEGSDNFVSDSGVLYNHDKTRILRCPCAKTSYEFPITVTEIGQRAFGECIGLTSVDIPNSVTSIESGAFVSCSSLASVVIPEGVEYLLNNLFSGCTNLSKIVDLNPTPQGIGDNVFKEVPDNAVIYIPKGSFVAYMTADGWTKFNDFREMGAFDVSLSVSSLELPAGDSATITATIEKDSDVTIGSEEWSSSDPSVATVEDGKVTAVAEGNAVISYTVYDGYGVPHTESCNVTVNAVTAVDAIFGDDSTSVDIFTMSGVVVAVNIPLTDLEVLPAGLYIVRQGAKTRKIAVK